MQMTLTASALRDLDRGKAELGRLVQANDTAATRAWAQLWSDVESDLLEVLDEMADEGVTRTRILRSQRLVNLLKVIDRSLQTEVGNAANRAVTTLGPAIEASVAAQTAAIGRQVRDTPFSRIDQGQVRAMVERSTQRIITQTAGLTDEAMLRMTASLNQGFAEGVGPRRAARMLHTAVNDAVNMPLSRALLITRTETLDAYRVAAERSQDAAADVLTGWVWIASLGPRTCMSCAGKHGEQHPLSEGGPLDHHAGRCTRAPVSKTYRQLGIDLPEPKSAVPDADAWFNALDDKTKRDILGPTRLELWRNGDLPRDQWSVRVPNPGWRDAYVPRPLNKTSSARG